MGYYLAYKLAVGAAVGWLLGTLLMQLIFRTKVHTRLAETGEGFVALAVTLLVYGAAELLQGYGFLAVFVAALALRHFEREHEYHSSLHDFAEQTERLLMVIVLVLFGGAIAGGLLHDLTWAGVLAGAAVVFVVRPLFGLLGFWGSLLPLRERLALAFFGIRGVGSFYYLAYAVNQADFPGAETLWSDVGFVVLLSVFVHGVTAPKVIERLDEKREAEERTGDYAPTAQGS